ncbi:hypothetical protein ABKN59_003339 [Abortiporus biennis]
MSDVPPSYSHYAFCSNQAVPQYTELPSRCERLLRTSDVGQRPSMSEGSRSTSYEREYVYKSDSFTLNLGRQRWGLLYAAYGRNGVVSGTVKFRKRLSHVLSVTVQLEGYVTSSVSQTLAVGGNPKRTLVSRRVDLFTASNGDSVHCGREFDFEIPLPEYTTDIEDHVPLPPSSTSYHGSAAAEITYTIQVDVARKGFRRHENRSTPILYLPKTRPTLPPLTAIPPILPDLVVNERVRKVKVPYVWPKGHAPTATTTQELPTIHLLIPSPSCFTSGDCIPLSLSIMCPHAPAIPKLLTPNVGVFLVKKKKMWISQGREISVKEVLVSKATEFRMGDLREGTRYLTMEMQAGEPGYESSWMLDGSVGVEYAIRVIIRPPCYAKHLPAFQHDEPVELTTDQFGSLERELLTMNGVPTPALGLYLVPGQVRPTSSLP